MLNANIYINIKRGNKETKLKLPTSLCKEEYDPSIHNLPSSSKNNRSIQPPPSQFIKLRTSIIAGISHKNNQ